MESESNLELIQYSSSLSVIGNTVICIFFTVVILYFYLNRRLSAAAALLFAWSSQAFGILFIGPTFNAFLFIQYFLVIMFLLRNKKPIPKLFLYILLLPILSNILIFIYISLGNDFFFYHGKSKILFYIAPLYFYVKFYIPLFLTGFVIVEDKKSTIDDFFRTVEIIAKWSCVIAIVQLIFSKTFNSIDLDELIGLKRRYIDIYDTSILSVRVQAFMLEPKDLGCFLSLAIPILLKKKKYTLVLVSCCIALLTQSQTFIVLIAIALIVFFLLNKFSFYSIRRYIVITMGIMIGTFQIASISKDHIIENYTYYKDNIIFELIAKRAISRYADFKDILSEDEIEVAGMPLQKDVEMPILKFLKDYPFLWFTGVGPGNTKFIDPVYYEGSTTYKDRVNGEGAPLIAMRWLNYVVNFGFFVSFFIFLKLTDINNKSIFLNKYYAFLWVSLFFAVIDVWIVIFYGLIFKESNENTIGKTP